VAVWAQLFTSSKAVFKPVGAAFAQALLQAARSLQTYPGMFHRRAKNDNSLWSRVARSIAALRRWRETMVRFRTEAASRSAAAASEVKSASDEGC
jgi:hypothetical protein